MKRYFFAVLLFVAANNLFAQTEESAAQFKDFKYNKLSNQ
jgi:hypothetical protein